MTRKAQSRYTEILTLMAQGYITKEIAPRIGISTKAVESHRARMMEHYGARSIAHLMVIAVREGLIEVK